MQRLLILALGCTLLAACASAPKRNPLPEALAYDAAIAGIPEARTWADEPSPRLNAWLEQPREALKAELPDTFGQPHHYLAISGGGARGAFTAGLLNGWTAAGDRPEFTIVTGVSTGALIAPFAFLGPKYDAVVKELYTTNSTDDLVRPRSPLAAITGDAATDSSPLREKLVRYVDEALMAEIAAEHLRGRTLVIGTTNLDAGRLMSWNIGRIAVSGAPGALDLIRDVMLASASLPVAFPPVLFEVQADGQTYDELHVDGGATSVVYLYPLGLDWARLLEHLEVPEPPNVYVIRNGQLDIPWETVEPHALDIAVRTLATLGTSTVFGDMNRIYLATRRDGLNYHLAYIPASFTKTAAEPFDQDYMTALYELGFELAKEGFDWARVPPGYDVEEAGTDAR